MASDGSRLLRSLVHSLRTRGLTATLRWAWLGCTRSHTFQVYAAQGSPLHEVEPNEALSMVQADGRSIEQLQQSADFQTPEAFISKTLQYSQCLLALRGGEPVHVMVAISVRRRQPATERST
jgi:hypothetical protein